MPSEVPVLAKRQISVSDALRARSPDPAQLSLLREPGTHNPTGRLAPQGGGIGFAKTGGNYAASLIAQQKAHDAGFSQILWLDGVERKYIEEVGAMNIFFKIAGKVVTPALNGSILPGITRDSVIQVCKDWGYEVEERKISAEELLEAQAKGTLEECWGTGTAAVISPVGKLRYKNDVMDINGGEIGELSQKLYDTITGIQLGRLPDERGWRVKVGK